MSEKPAFFPEESEPTRIAPHPPPLQKTLSMVPESEGERENLCDEKNGEGGVSKWTVPGEERFF